MSVVITLRGEAGSVTAVDGGPLLLVTTALPSCHQHPGPAGETLHPNLGRLLTPRHYSSVEATGEIGLPWAADNDCFQGLDARRWLGMLDRVAGVPGCRFATVPDSVGDAVTTARMFDQWAPSIERRGLPVALVAQDGLEDLPGWLNYQWHRLSAIFIGGSTEWKLGPHAAELARRAKADGKWVHWGRVNTRKRFDYIMSTGACDSFDGSQWARWRKTYLDTGLSWCAEARPGLSVAA